MALTVLRLGLFAFISALPLCVLGANYVLPPGWDPYNSSYYHKARISGKYPHYVVSNGSSDIVSDNGTFALLVDPYVNELSLAMTSNYSPPYTEVFHWERFDELTNIQLDECGLIHIIYKSFLGQDVHTIRKLFVPMCTITSRPATPEDSNVLYAGQFYSAVLHAGGLALESNSGAYFGAWSLSNHHNIYFSSCLGYQASLILEKNGSLILMYTKDPYTDYEAPECLIPPMTLPFRKLDHPANTTPMILPFIKMTEHDEVALYKLDIKQQTWVMDSVLILETSCKFINACGRYGVCDLNGECNESLATGSTDRGSRDLLYAGQHNLIWSRRGVGYIATKFPNEESLYLSDLYNFASFESCTNFESKFRASFYDHSAGVCHLFRTLPMVSLHRHKNMTAVIYFSVRDHPLTLPSSKPVLKFGIVIAAAYLVLTIFAIAFLPIMQRKISSINPAKEVEALLSTMQGLPQRFTYTELEAATRGFSTKLGAGAFGSVYEGFIAKDERHIAVKKLNDNGTESAKQFVTEISGIGGVSHYNIVKLCGFCIDGASKKLLVYEFMPNGSLDGWLFGEKTLSWEQRCNIALGTARGLFYLHEECSEPILHLDIKPQNILLDDKFEAKVADFGMAKMLGSRDVTHIQTNVRGTPGYMAPEWLLHFAATKKCDVYSYGMLLLELIGGRKNIDLAKINNDNSSWYFPARVVDRVKEKDILKVVDERIRESKLIHGAETMVSVALWCIQENPVMRPSMREVLDMLQNHRKVEEPPMSFYFDHADHSEITGMTSRVSSVRLYQSEETY